MLALASGALPAADLRSRFVLADALLAGWALVRASAAGTPASGLGWALFGAGTAAVVLLSRRLSGLAVAGGAAAAAVLIPAGPALGFYSPPLLLQIHVNSASLVARGAGADVSVTTKCAGTLYADAQVTLTERSGNGIASGVAAALVRCTDSSHTAKMLVTSEAGGKAFRKGIAITQGVISGCTPAFCGSQQYQHTITIK